MHIEARLFLLSIGEEDDESSEPEDVPSRTPSRFSATPTDERQTREGVTPIETDADQR